MSILKDFNDGKEVKSAAQLVRVWERAPNYPRTAEGVEFLARGLEKAAEKLGIDPERIVTACVEISRHCPTDAELLAVAANLAQPDCVAAEHEQERDWHRDMQRTYGPPVPFVCDWTLAAARKVKARESQMYREIRDSLKLKSGKFADGRTVTWEQMADAAEKLGYRDYAEAWRNSLVNGIRARGRQSL